LPAEPFSIFVQVSRGDTARAIDAIVGIDRDTPDCALIH